MTMDKKILDKMRDCVKKALLEGCENKDCFYKMRHGITVESLRLGCEPSEVKDILTEWNKKCARPLGPARERDELHKYVNWVVSKKCKVGCKALQDFCIGKEICKFHFRVTSKNRQQTEELPFDRSELSRSLDKDYKADAYLMMIIVNVLRYIQVEKATGPVILIGFRGIQSLIRDRYKHNIDLMTIRRRMYQLMEAGVIQQEVKGKPGTYYKQANGYRFLPWRPSPPPLPPPPPSQPTPPSPHDSPSSAGQGTGGVNEGLKAGHSGE